MPKARWTMQELCWGIGYLGIQDASRKRQPMFRVQCQDEASNSESDSGWTESAGGRGGGRRIGEGMTLWTEV
eukprot:scaffold120260_cov62-Attheya_sp.AAC.2